MFISLFFLHPSLHVTSCHFPPFSPLISSAKLSSAAVATPTPGSRVPPRWTKMDPASNTNQHSLRHCVQSQGPQGLQGSPASMPRILGRKHGFSWVFIPFFHGFPSFSCEIEWSRIGPILGMWFYIWFYGQLPAWLQHPSNGVITL